MEWTEVIFSVFQQVLFLVVNLDQTLEVWSQAAGLWLYLILFLIIFAETGLIVTPFLPGDSLLFAVGAMCALNTGLEVEYMGPLLIIAAILGDSTNYAIGNRVGPKIFKNKDSRFFKHDHLMRAQSFYEKYGAKAIIIGRFMPIVRTFVPFVAGIAKMDYPKFLKANVFGAIIWILSFLLAGYFFGNLPIVKRNFTVVIFAVIIISILPIFIELYRARKAR